ncbi:hypothetical protein GGR50DRAFT_493556 [Xylaria sp. CBS 124048]|nr:hypothetical protein GGR50DRAFT_493556 [Xylaria sp. CBS 124048]
MFAFRPTLSRFGHSTCTVRLGSALPIANLAVSVFDFLFLLTVTSPLRCVASSTLTSLQQLSSLRPFTLLPSHPHSVEGRISAVPFFFFFSLSPCFLSNFSFFSTPAFPRLFKRKPCQGRFRLVVHPSSCPRL